jgi:hypothetical protein
MAIAKNKPTAFFLTPQNTNYCDDENFEKVPKLLPHKISLSQQIEIKIKYSKNKN